MKHMTRKLGLFAVLAFILNLLFWLGLLGGALLLLQHFGVL